MNKPILTQFTQRRWKHEPVYGPIGLWAIYERSHPEVAGSHFELAKLRWRGQREAFGKTIAGGWQYPKSEDWGLYGFTYPTLEAAKAKLGAIKPIMAPPKHGGSTMIDYADIEPEDNE